MGELSLAAGDVSRSFNDNVALQLKRRVAFLEKNKVAALPSPGGRLLARGGAKAPYLETGAATGPLIRRAGK